jgi:D-alanyl-D-alanine carboxypeptidase
VPTPSRAQVSVVAAALALSVTCAAPASAEALLLVEADSGKVLLAENATYPWYPASVTKIMTAYVTLRAVKEGRLTLETLLRVSANAAAQAPSKMGFAVGTTITVDNALKMLMVKSANDVAVVLAEGVSGSVEKFSDEMNRAARRLGMTQSTFVNPNGLPSELQITSARDLAILARAVIREMPEYEIYWHLPAIRFGKRVMRNHNTLIGRYGGADGMKTGFICASGFNVVATATRDGKRLIAVVLGAPSSPVRAVKAAHLLERGFSGAMLSWLTPSLGRVEALAPIDAEPPNLREEMCGKNRRRPAAEEEDDNSGSPFMLSGLRGSIARPSTLLGPLVDSMPPVAVHTGVPKKPAGSQIAVSAAPKPAARRVAPRTPPAGQEQPAVAGTGRGGWTGFTPAAAAAPPQPREAEPVSAPSRRPKPQVIAAPPREAAPRDAAPRTAAPRTAAPKTAAPKTAASREAAPRTAAPTTVAPRTAPPRAATPKPAAPKPAALQTAAPRTAAPQIATPQIIAPEVTVPKRAAPKRAAHKPVAPKTAAPQSAAPKSSAPRSAAPKSVAAKPTSRAATPRAADKTEQ